MPRIATGKFVNIEALDAYGIQASMLKESIDHTYILLDQIDVTLQSVGAEALSQTVELANLSSMLGNVFAAAIARHSKGLLRRNGPHKYPDLLPTEQSTLPPLEIKVALETNKPKGHLAKAGWYLTARYVLCEQLDTPRFVKAARGASAYIWELRLGILKDEHFNISNTEGDSGKTAVVNREGMEALKVVYIDHDLAPIGKKVRLTYAGLIEIA